MTNCQLLPFTANPVTVTVLPSCHHLYDVVIGGSKAVSPSHKINNYRSRGTDHEQAKCLTLLAAAVDLGAF